MSAIKKVTERDFRMDQFKDSDPDDYEFRADGVIVRKDRWEQGIRSIARILGCSNDFEIDNLVNAVSDLNSFAESSI